MAKEMTPEEIDAELEDILTNEDSKANRAYFNSAHILHNKTVERVSELARLKLGDGLYENEGATVVSTNAITNAIHLTTEGERV